MTTEVEEQDLQSGQRFGDYEVVRLLGRGAFGAVYEALRMPLKKRVALKVLHREYVRHREVCERFLREAEVVAQLEHPHIVGVFDVGVADGAPFIAMEFLDGESLSSLMERDGPMQVSRVVNIMLPVLSGIATVHAKGIVHRDLKPDNLFIANLATGGTQPKLLDFGIAKVRDADKVLTRTNAVMGTPYYMSPEQVVESKSVDAQSDQWSLAVIVFECLTGQKPFDGDSLIALLNAITAKPIPSIRSVRADVPEGFSAIISRAMERIPAARWPSARAFGAALLPFATPAAQEQWRSFFGESIATPSTAELSATLPASAPLIDAVAPIVPSTPATLEPATRSSIGLSRRPRRKIALAAGAFAVAAVAIVVGWTGTRGSRGVEAGHGAHAVMARPVEVPAAHTPVVPDAGSTAAAAQVALPQAARSDPSAHDGPRVERPEYVSHARHVGRHGARAGAATNASSGHTGSHAQDCPNGVCAPD